MIDGDQVQRIVAGDDLEAGFFECRAVVVNRDGVVRAVRVAADIRNHGQSAPVSGQRFHRDKRRQGTADQHAVDEDIRPVDLLEGSATLRLLEVPLDGLEPQRSGQCDGATAAPPLRADYHDHRLRRGPGE